ncbi:MAG: hypothetical protein RLZZ419_1884 [Pseudomonadota bacterium]|jgi:hypothetical protein
MPAIFERQCLVLALASSSRAWPAPTKRNSEVGGHCKAGIYNWHPCQYDGID